MAMRLTIERLEAEVAALKAENDELKQQLAVKVVEERLAVIGLGISLLFPCCLACLLVAMFAPRVIAMLTLIWHAVACHPGK